MKSKDLRFRTMLLSVPIAFLLGLPAKAQVTIGSLEQPQNFSLLELDSKDIKKGLRLSQLTNDERNALNIESLTSEIAEKARGLLIYNVSIGCLEYWNGTKWVSLCEQADNHTLTIDNGIGVSTYTYAGGQTITITAGTPPEGSTFLKWVADGDDVIFGDANSSTTTIIMPARDVTVTAIFHKNVRLFDADITTTNFQFGDEDVSQSFRLENLNRDVLPNSLLHPPYLKTGVDSWYARNVTTGKIGFYITNPFNMQTDDGEIFIGDSAVVTFNAAYVANHNIDQRSIVRLGVKTDDGHYYWSDEVTIQSDESVIATNNTVKIVNVNGSPVDHKIKCFVLEITYGPVTSDEDAVFCYIKTIEISGDFTGPRVTY